MEGDSDRRRTIATSNSTPSIVATASSILNNHRTSATVVARPAAAPEPSQTHHHHGSAEEEDEDIRTEFCCPYCYKNFDLASLGLHLEDEHRFESRMAICPVCSAKVWRDVAGHVMLQHGHLFKIHSQNRCRKSKASSNSTLSLLGQELAELQALIGDVPSTGTISSTLVEALLSSLGCKLPSSETNTSENALISVPDQKNESLKCDQPDSGLEVSVTTEERDQRLKQAARRADFVQQIVLSTFMDSR